MSGLKAASPNGAIKNGEAYLASKAALNMLAVVEAGNRGHEGLKVFVMSPGCVR